MKEALVSAGPKVQIQDSDIPSPPSPNHLVIHVHTSGTNPKDWKYAEWRDLTMNAGDDIAGIVHSIGSDVKEFKPGDRVAAFHEIGKPGGSFAEYAVAYKHTTFHIPSSTSYEEAATIPLAAMTSAIGLFQRLKLPVPWVTKTTSQKTSTPILVYGGASAVGAFAIKLLKIAQIGPIIAVAGRGIPYVKSLLDPSTGDIVLDYRDPDLITSLTNSLNGRKLLYAYDAISENGSFQTISKVLDREDGLYTNVLPAPKDSGLSDSAIQLTMVSSAHSDDTESPGTGDDKFFAYAFYRFMAKGLELGWFKPHPYEVVPGGLNGLEKALIDLKGGKASAIKYVVRLDETEGVEKWKEE